MLEKPDEVITEKLDRTPEQIQADREEKILEAEIETSLAASYRAGFDRGYKEGTREMIGAFFMALIFAIFLVRFSGVKLVPE